MLVYDDDGEELGDFREEDFAVKTLLYCIGIVAIIAFVWWVLQVADPALDKLDAMRVK